MKNLIKHIPNLLSGSRIIVSTLLLFYNEFAVSYLIMYGYCALSDLIDGPIARKTGSTSLLGAVLDAIGDTIVALSVLKIMLYQKLVEPWFIVVVAAASVLFFVSALISKKKFNKFYFPHTYFDKLLGTMTYCLPIEVNIMDHKVLMVSYAVVYCISALETLYIQLRAKEARSFVPSIFHIDKAE